jgi:hypothetical protein
VAEEKKSGNIPCCVADAIWRVGQIEVAGRIVGIANLSEIFSEVGDLGLITDSEVRAELLKRVREANYIPPGMEDAYADAIHSKYHEQTPSQNRGYRGR